MSIELLLASYAKKQLSDSGGRQVVDKMFDVSLNRRIVEWNGTDRPEFTDFDGAKVCVEAERTNLCAWSNKFDESEWEKLQITVQEEGYSDITGGTVWRITDTVFTDSTGRLRQNAGLGNADDRAFQLWMKAGTKSRVNLVNSSIASTNDLHGILLELGTGDVIAQNGVQTLKIKSFPDGWWHIQAVFEPWDSGAGWEDYLMIGMVDDDSTNLTSSAANRYDGNGTGTIYISKAQPEIGSYPTLYIPTSGSTVTRLAPTSTVSDVLPSSGSLAGIIDMVRDDSVNQDIFTSSGDSSTELSRLRLNTSNEFELQIFGSNGGSITQSNPFTEWDNNSRKSFKHSVFYDSDNIYLYLSDGESEFLYSASHDINSTSERDVSFGNNSSIRMTIPLYVDDVERTQESDFQSLFNVLE